MLPLRQNDTLRSVLSAGIAAIVATVGTFTTLSVGTNGAALDGSYRTTISVDPASIPAGSSTTTVVSLTGAAAGDHCMVNATDGDLLSTTSTVVLV